MSSTGGITFLKVDTIMAFGRAPERLSLPALQSKMKIDPEGYDLELQLLYKQFNSSLEIFMQQAALNFNSLSGIGADPRVAKDLGDRAMFLAHMVPFYRQHLSLFPNQLAEFLKTSARSLPSSLRCCIVQALIHIMNEKAVDIEEMLSLFMELQTLGDKMLRKTAYEHVVNSIRRMNQKHKDEAKNRALQRILSEMVQRDEESIAKISLIVLCDLHKRKVWNDERTASAICMACLHPLTKIMRAALHFLLDYEIIEDDDDDSDSSSSEDRATPQNPQGNNKGKDAIKKKKKGKKKRVNRSKNRQQHLSSEKTDSSCYSPLNHLKDAQGFAEKLFSRLKSHNKCLEVKMMLLKVTARTIGLHRLLLLDFYKFLQKHVQPHKHGVMNTLAAAVQACHDMVPPDAVEPLFEQIVKQFINDRSRPEAIAVGLNFVREICWRMPLLMKEDLLQDLVLYRKHREKAVSCAARSIMSLFREICPSLLMKKDRGRPINPTARPKAYGEVDVASNVSGIELLQDNADDSDADEDEGMDSDTEFQDLFASGSDEDDEDIDLDLDSDSDADASQSGDEELGASDDDEEDEDGNSADDSASDVDASDDEDGEQETKIQSNSKKRKALVFDGQLNAADNSLRNLKKLASIKLGNNQTDSEDGILSNEEFKRIKHLKAKGEAKAALLHHGLMQKGSDSNSGAIKIPTADQLSLKPVDPSLLEERMHKKMTKDERLALMKAGREDRGKYQAKTALKQKKTGGSSNKQKEHKKFMPIAAKRAKVAKTRLDKKRKLIHSGKQFRGRKAWK